MKRWLDEALSRLQDENRCRTLHAIERIDGVQVRRGNRTLRLFSSNDYLGLSWHPQVRAAAAQAAQQFGMGPRGAALICGYTTAHEALEFELAKMKGCEAALLMPSGYQANVGLLSALGGEDATIFSDALNHASIIDGCRLSKAKVVVYAHCDLNDLEQKLKVCDSKRRIVVTDEVFSMDGDRAPLVQLANLRDRYGFIWVTDSAHSTGVYGHRGAGLPEAAGVTSEIDFQVGTLSKALGAQGGFVATSTKARDWLLNSARAFVFSTALPGPVIAAAHTALSTMTNDQGIHDDLWNRVTQLAKWLRIPPTGPIFPIILGSETRALQAATALDAAGFHVPAIRPPTVPEGTCRLRVTVSAAHASSDVSALIKALEGAGVVPT